MTTERILSPAHSLFEASFSLLETAFPPEERRTRADHIRFLEKPDFHCCALKNEDGFCGILFYWEAETFIFLEHFAILPHLRGQGLGAAALSLLKSLGKPVILEIEPPCDEMTQRRYGFYRRNGFLMNPFFHLQAKLRQADEADVELKVLSFPQLLSQEAYDAFYAYMLQEIDIRNNQ